MGARATACLAMGVTAVVPFWAIIQDLGTFELCWEAVEAADMARMRGIALRSWAVSLFCVGVAVFALMRSRIAPGQKRALAWGFGVWKLSGFGLAFVMMPPCWENYTRPAPVRGRFPWVEDVLSLATFLGWVSLLVMVLLVLIRGQSQSQSQIRD